MGEEPPELVRDEAEDAGGRADIGVGGYDVGFGLGWGWGWWGVHTRGRVSALEKYEGKRRDSFPGVLEENTRNSTAVADAIAASPGRATVHIWLSVRLERHYQEQT